MKFNTEHCCPPISFPIKQTVSPDPCAGYTYTPELVLWNIVSDSAFSPLSLNFGDDMQLELRNIAALPDAGCCPDAAWVTFSIEPGTISLTEQTPPESYLGVTFEFLSDAGLRVINFGTNSIVFFVNAHYHICGQVFTTSVSFDVLTI